MLDEGLIEHEDSLDVAGLEVSQELDDRNYAIALGGPLDRAELHGGTAELKVGRDVELPEKDELRGKRESEDALVQRTVALRVD